MKASSHNIETVMIFLHKKIEEYTDFLTTQIHSGNAIDHVSYPPNNTFTKNEIDALNHLRSNQDLRSALNKLIADSIAGVIFDLMNVIDGTSDPEEAIGKWTELSLVDKTDTIEQPTEMLHDTFIESYWAWRKISPKQE